MDYSLFSGGHDSLVSTHFCMTNGKTEKVLHLDTNAGIPETQEYVKEVCERYEWPLVIEEAPVTFKELVLEYGSEPYGFPGPPMHIWAYSMLKERSLRNVAKRHDDKPHYWTGVRKSESDRRMTTISEGKEEVLYWIWHTPIADWSEKDINSYIEKHNLSRSPVVENMCMSGECLCGAFSHRDEELIDLQAHYPETYERLMDLEEEVINELGEDCDKAYWAHGSSTKSEMKALKNEYEPKSQVLCSDCKDSLHESATDW